MAWCRIGRKGVRWAGSQYGRGPMNNVIDKFLNFLDSKLHTRSFLAVSSFITNLTGCALIYAGVRDTGSLDFKTAFIEGRLQSGMVGLLVVLIGTIIALG